MRLNAKQDLAGGMLAVALGGVLLAWGIPLHVQEDVDLRLPVSTMPKIVAVLFVLVGLLQILRTLVASRVVSAPTDPVIVGGPPKRVALVFAIMVATVVVLRWMPFLAVMPLFTFGLALLYGGGGRLRPFIIAVLAPVAIYVVVHHGFTMPLP